MFLVPVVGLQDGGKDDDEGEIFEQEEGAEDAVGGDA
jgi:hypothetical protein